MPLRIRRVVTGHDENGKSVLLMDCEASNVRFRHTTGIHSTLLWTTDSTPANISGIADEGRREIGVAPPQNGSIFRIVEIPPEKEVGLAMSNDEMIKEMGLQGISKVGEKPRHPAMHVTKSIDYGVVLAGEIDMLLDDSEVHLNTGDVIVQRGTNHAWVNRGDEPCCIAFVLIDAAIRAEGP